MPHGRKPSAPRASRVEVLAESGLAKKGTRISVHQNLGVNPHFSWSKTKPNLRRSQHAGQQLILNVSNHFWGEKVPWGGGYHPYNTSEVRIPSLSRKELVARLGVEPRQNESESFVLPLHHQAVENIGKNGAGDGIRTRNRLFTKQVLYH
jgi:hypothetical protein